MPKATDRDTLNTPAPETPNVPAAGQAMILMAAADFAFRTVAFNQMLRDLADMMDASFKMDGSVEEDETIQASEVAGWVLRLDAINNLAAEGADEFADYLRNAKVRAPLGYGSVMRRDYV